MKKFIIVISILLFFALFVPALGRYATKQIKEYYLSSKNFYFNGDKMEPEDVVYQVQNWNGIDEYTVTFNMNSYKNNIVYSDTDIAYDIEYECIGDVTCSINKTSGLISSDKHVDSFSVTIFPNRSLQDGEKVTIKVKATSTSPYKKELKGTFNVVVGKMGLSYEIIDEKGRSYFEVAITNTLDYYVALNDSNGYVKGEKVDIASYLKLSDKTDFASSIVEITFDPSLVVLDTTSKDYLDAISTTTRRIDGYDYINQITFKIEALSSNKVKFYKVNYLEDYTNDSSIVNVIFK